MDGVMNLLFSRFGILVACCGAVVFSCGGCGPKGPDVVKVTGTITKGGRPVSNMVVQFYPEKGRPSAARTDDNGFYELEFSEAVPKGAVPGKHNVSLQVLQESIDKPINLKDPKYHPDTRAILRDFGNWKNTKLQVEVTHDQPVVDIELDDYEMAP
jgi:hypothetical protein